MEDLPHWPSRGNRRKLEESWLRQLELHGLSAFLGEEPSKAPEALPGAVQQFNRGDFWGCHETLEEVWLETPYPLRLFYHSIIKVAVGLYHVGRHNRHGARVKLSDGVRVLQLFPQEFMGVSAGRLHDDACRWLALVDSSGRIDWSELDALPRPTIEIVDGRRPGLAEQTRDLPAGRGQV